MGKGFKISGHSLHCSLGHYLVSDLNSSLPTSLAGSTLSLIFTPLPAFKSQNFHSSSQKSETALPTSLSPHLPVSVLRSHQYHLESKFPAIFQFTLLISIISPPSSHTIFISSFPSFAYTNSLARCSFSPTDIQCIP